MDFYSIEEAARMMRLHPAHVRRLAREGQIPARKIGERWIVDGDALRQRDLLVPSPGRAVSPEMSWDILTFVDCRLQPCASSDSGLLVQRSADRRARHRLRRLLAKAPATATWAYWLRRRARAQRVWVHPGVIPRLAKDPRLHPGGESAYEAAGPGSARATASEHVFYVSEADAADVLHDYRGRQDFGGSVQLMIIPTAIAGQLNLAPGAVVPAAVALVDLVASPDARQRRLAADLLESAIAEAGLAASRH